MSTTLEELNRFREFAEEKISNGHVDWSLEQLVDLWKFENPTQERLAVDVQAVKEALRDLDNGEVGISHEQFMRELRARFGLVEQ